MAKLTPTGSEYANNLAADALVATGNGANAVYKNVTAGGLRSGSKINVAAYGTFVGTVVLETSFDGGTNWLPVQNSAGTAIQLTAPGCIAVDAPEEGMLFRLRCSAFTSGTINTRISQ